MHFNSPTSALIDKLVINHVAPKAAATAPAPKQEEANVLDSAIGSGEEAGAQNSAAAADAASIAATASTAPEVQIGTEAPAGDAIVDKSKTPDPGNVSEVKLPKGDGAVLDDAGESIEELADSDTYTMTDIALKAVASVQEWAETSADDLDSGEGLADRLFGLLAGIADENMDGEISEDEQGVLVMACEAAWDYMAGKGASDEDCAKLFNDWDNEVAATLQGVVAGALPDGDEAAAEDMDSFVFGDGSDEAALDAVYKKRLVIRKGKKVRINKRVSGKVRLSAKQKIGIKKARMKSHRAGAQVRRAKSMKIRQKMGLK